MRLNPQIFSEFYDTDLIAFGTGSIGRRIIPYLAKDPNIRLLGVTNSRITEENVGTFLETDLPIRSIYTWAEYAPHAVILVTPFLDTEDIIRLCEEVGFRKFKFITPEMMEAVIKVEEQLAESDGARIFEYMCLSNELHHFHKVAFSEFKDCHRGKSLAVVGTGPTLSYYDQIPGVPHIGVNSSFLKDDLNLDYYFVTHYNPEWCKKLKEYNFIKFFNENLGRNFKDRFPEYIIEENCGRRCFSASQVPTSQIHPNIEYYPLMSYGSIIFRALHFAIYTHPKRILLIGCDCSQNTHFNENSQTSFVGVDPTLTWINGYKQVKEFMAVHYPDIEMVSVNPVGLKGLFRDVYTERYINAHPPIKPCSYEILHFSDY